MNAFAPIAGSGSPEMLGRNGGRISFPPITSKGPRLDHTSQALISFLKSNNMNTLIPQPERAWRHDMQGGCDSMISSAAVEVPLLIDAKKAASLCGICESTWWNHHRAGRCPKPIRLGHRTLWKRDEIRAWVAANCPPRSRWNYSPRTKG